MLADNTEGVAKWCHRCWLPFIALALLAVVQCELVVASKQIANSRRELIEASEFDGKVRAMVS